MIRSSLISNTFCKVKLQVKNRKDLKRISMSNITLKYAFLMFLLQTICTSSLLILETDLEKKTGTS